MPAIWLVPIVGIDPTQVRIQHLHAAMSWFLDDKHTAVRKTWSVARPATATELVIRTLTTHTANRLRRNVRPGVPLQLGRQLGAIAGEPQIVQEESWDSLCRPSGAESWTLEFLSPTALSSGSWASPLLAPDSLLLSLLQRWTSALATDSSSVPELPAPSDPGLDPGRKASSQNAQSATEYEHIAKDAKLPRGNTTYTMAELCERRWTREELRQLHVTYLAGETLDVHIPLSKKEPSQASRISMKKVPGFRGVMSFRASDSMLAALTDCLFRFAEYSGVGSQVSHGMGTVQIVR